MLDRTLDVVELVQDGFAERRGPVELVVHAGNDLRIVQQADHARVPVGIGLQLGLLRQLAQEPAGRDDVDREGRALQHQDQQRIGIERDRGHQDVELLRSEEIRLGRDVSGGWLLGSCRGLLRCGLGRDVPGGRLLSCCRRLLRCGLCVRLEVRPADGNDQCRGGYRPVPRSRDLPPPCHRCPLCSNAPFRDPQAGNTQIQRAVPPDPFTSRRPKLPSRRRRHRQRGRRAFWVRTSRISTSSSARESRSSAIRTARFGSVARSHRRRASTPTA